MDGLVARGVTQATLIGGEPTLVLNRIKPFAEKLPYLTISTNGLRPLPMAVDDDGPLPDVYSDVIEGQRAMRANLEGVGFAIMVATMLHSIATGNLLPASIPLVSVDINPATVTKLADRGSAQAVGIVTDIESRLGTRYTADTLARLTEKYRSCRFVWLMGADNLGQIDRWKAWTHIFHLLPIAVFDRPTYTYGALAAKAARRFARQRKRESASQLLALASTPAWMFVHHRLNPISATAIRAAASKAQALASNRT